MSDEQPSFDDAKAHRRFAAECFNTAWELIEKPDRTPEDVEEMIHRAHASRWHWGHSPDHKPHNLAVGHWQLARVYALAGRLDEATHYAQKYHDETVAHNFGAFDLGFAYEALARIEGLAGRLAQRDAYLAKAQEAAAKVSEKEDRQWLESNLGPLALGEHQWPLKING